MNLFVAGLLTAAVAIDAAEIVFKYGLGDKTLDLFNYVKGFVLKLFGKAKPAEQASASEAKKS